MTLQSTDKHRFKHLYIKLNNVEKINYTLLYKHIEICTAQNIQIIPVLAA